MTIARRLHDLEAIAARRAMIPPPRPPTPEMEAAEAAFVQALAEGVGVDTAVRHAEEAYCAATALRPPAHWEPIRSGAWTATEMGAGSW